MSKASIQTTSTYNKALSLIEDFIYASNGNNISGVEKCSFLDQNVTFNIGNP